MMATSKPPFALGVVVYKPAALLLERLQFTLDLGIRIFVFDNSPDDERVRLFCREHQCVYLTCGKNVGMGVGLTSICAQSYYLGHRALLFFDQDTIYTLETLVFVGKVLSERPDLEEHYSAITFNAGRRLEQNAGIRDVLLAISSGSLFLLKNVRRIGWHNHSYFVDCVDYEFCLRSSNAKLRVGEYGPTPGFDHMSGQPDRKIVVFGQERMVRRYPLKRLVDTFIASTRLIVTSICTGNMRVAIAVARALAIYFYFQTIARTVNPNPTK